MRPEKLLCWRHRFCPRVMLSATIVAASWFIQLANGSPTWWYNLGAVDSTKQAEDSSIATIGQVKHMAVKAKSHLDGSLSGGAGSAINSLISLFTAPSASDSQVVQLGQLKYVASKFYDRLNAVGYPLNYTQHPQGYPWTSTTSDDANSSPALLGQVKEVFSFDLTGWTGSGGGNGGGPGAGAQIQDTDGDGISDKFEISIGLNPNVKDSDGDGTDDGDEDNDGDGLIDRNDPAPNNALIDWPKTGIPRYAVVDIPTGGIDPGAIQDVNSKGEVLFAKHYWRPGDPGLTALGHATGSIQLKAFFNQGQETQNLTAQPDAGQFWALSIGDGGKIAGVGVWEGTTVGGNHPGANREATRGIYWNTGASSVGTLVADDIDVYHSWIDGVNASGLFVKASRYNDWANKQPRLTLGGSTYTLQNDDLPQFIGGSRYLYMPASTPVSNGEFWVDTLVSELYYPGPQSIGFYPHVRDMERIVTQSGTRGLVGATSGVMVTNNSGVWQQMPQDPDGDGIQEFAQALGVSKYGHVLCDSLHVWIDGEYLLIWNLIAGSNYVFCKKMASNGVIAAERFSGAPVLLLPVEVVELAPQVLDESANPIVGSEKPNQTLPLTPFVEILPHTNKIAHRELKVKIGEALAGKTVTWTMEPLFVPNYDPNGPNLPPVFRGEWSHSSTHPNCFESSTTYGANGWVGISQASSRTTVSNDGFTAVRVNVPPIGFNQARIRIQIEGVTAPVDLIDMEVPAVVVIDPGHGGTASLPGSSWNNATSPSGVYEKTMALASGLALRECLRASRDSDRLNLRIFMTREDDKNRSGSSRAHVARDNGADIIFIIHFNSHDDPPGAHRARGTLQVTQHNNPNAAADAASSNTVIDQIVTAMQQFDPQANHRAAVPTPTDVADDVYLGNTGGYNTIRAPYCEVEFIDYGADTTSDQSDDAVDILMNTGPNASAVKDAIANAMRDGILQDLLDQPSQ